jgi:hypothetical protein
MRSKRVCRSKLPKQHKTVIYQKLTTMLCSPRTSGWVIFLLFALCLAQGMNILLTRYGGSSPKDLLCAKLEVAKVSVLSNSGSSGSSSALRASPIPVATNEITNEEPAQIEIDLQGVEPRAFDPWPKDLPLPCYPTDENWKATQHLPATEGFIYLKAYKTGSSTSSGINLRIARNVAKRANKDFGMCEARYDHAWANVLYSNRVPEKTFLWTVVRDPTKRVTSQFFHFQVSREKQEPTDATFIDYIKTGPQDMIEDYYLKALTLKTQFSKDQASQIINGIFSDYNFIGVTERMDESAVALAMLLG